MAEPPTAKLTPRADRWFVWVGRFVRLVIPAGRDGLRSFDARGLNSYAGDQGAGWGARSGRKPTGARRRRRNPCTRSASRPRSWAAFPFQYFDLNRLEHLIGWDC